MKERRPRLNLKHRQILHEINALPKDKKGLSARTHISAIDDTLATTFDTGKWFKEMTAFRKKLQTVAGVKR